RYCVPSSSLLLPLQPLPAALSVRFQSAWPPDTCTLPPSLAGSLCHPGMQNGSHLAAV
ncbi:Hypothetical predicted protein, partial [Marmota monax]